MRNKYRLKFEKTGALAFLGHLDLLRVFQRSVSRAKLPIAYSNGFNPHQLMSFALPIPLGVEAFCEYLDIELKIPFDTSLIIDNLNDSLPKGIKIIDVYSLEETDKASAAITIKASYKVFIPFDKEIYDNLDQFILNILNSETLIVNKKTKSGVKEMDIRQDIFQINNISQNNEILLEMLLSAGSKQNLKPEVVTQVIFTYAEKGFDPYKIKIQRRELILS